ncbi:hypothetical protein ACP4OV_012346 [Aristida adscensionis]
METAAQAVSHPKKRRRLEEISSSSPPQALQEKKLSPSARDEEEGDGIDLNSRLPEAVLGEIISRLPTKDAAHTQALASQWCHLWLSASAPLSLDHSSLPGDHLVQAGLISRILRANPGPACRFSVRPVHQRRRPETVEAWLRSPALRGLQELEFFDAGRALFVYKDMPPLPASTFEFSATLRVVTFCQCRILDGTVEALHFPHLKQLALICLTISEHALHGMIHSCPVLETLLLKGSLGLSTPLPLYASV